MPLLPLAQGPRHHMPAGARQSPGILFSHHHQIYPYRQRQGVQRRPQRTQRLLPFLRGERGLGHHHQQIDVGIGPPIPPCPGAKQQYTPWPGFNPGQGVSHRLQVGFDCGGWVRHGCRLGRWRRSTAAPWPCPHPALARPATRLRLAHTKSRQITRLSSVMTTASCIVLGASCFCMRGHFQGLPSEQPMQQLPLDFLANPSRYG